MARDVDYARAMQRALERYGDEEDDRGGSRLARRIPASTLSVADVAEAVSDQLQTQKRELLKHISRLLELQPARRPDRLDRWADELDAVARRSTARRLAKPVAAGAKALPPH